MIKAAGGGGGRGIKIAEDRATQLRTAWSRKHATRPRPPSATAALYIEKVIRDARHIEVQVLGDGNRRRPLLRARMLVAAPAAEGLGGGAGRRAERRTAHRPSARAAVRAGEVGGLPRRRHAGVPLRRPLGRAFYFIEMNTRIQVEHPVTEMITGIDLVAEMMRIAGGEPLRLKPRRTISLKRSRHRGPHQRRGPGQQLHALGRAWSRRCPVPAGGSCALR